MALTYSRDPFVRNAATVVFIVAIAAIGAVMMGLTSSPAAKGAALLWLPAALQLIAGVWLGRLRGFLAGAIGAYAAGAVAYGGLGLPDFVMNFVAGGVANAWLPAVLFQAFRIDPAFAKGSGSGFNVLLIVVLLAIVIVLAFVQRPILKQFGVDEGTWGYVVPLAAVVIAIPLIAPARGAAAIAQFALAAIIVIGSCFVSAAIGVCGAMLSGQSFLGAVFSVGVGWFLGDTISALVGLYALASLTPWARERGFAPLPSK